SDHQNVMEQFNPGLRNVINLGKNYEKAVNAMILAGRAYYDGVAKIGEIATASPVSKELGHVLIEISSTNKILNDSLEESFKKFHKEIISELEKKTELDVKYMNATLKRYQTEHRSKLDSLEKSQAELKKIKRKSQGGRNAMKYENKEFECADLLNSKLPGWQEMCSDATKVPEKVMNMIEDMKTPGSTPISGTPQPSPVTERNSMVGRVPPAPTVRAFTSPLVDMFNNPPAVPKVPSERLSNSADNSDDASLSHSTSVATGLNIMTRQKVKTIFPHTAGTNKTLLSFAQGDVITLLIAEEKDGWLYGEHDFTKVKGWFPSSYTKLLEEPSDETVHVPVRSAAPIRSISSINIADKGGVVLPPPDYLGSLQTGTTSDMRVDSSKGTTVARPESTTPKPVINGIIKPPFLSGENPFTTVKLRPTVTNDRSAPIIR
ncbi:Brain-specific angiogenesis inhibitor 1-associated protein 2-like protein 1, partial [Chelonia mydas]